MLVWSALDEPFAIKGVQAIESRLIGGNLTAGLDFADQGGTVVLQHIALDELKHRLLLMRQGDRQARLRFEENRVIKR